VNVLEVTMLRRMSGAVLVVAAATLISCAPVFAKDAVDPAAQPTAASDADPFPISVRVTPGTVLVAKPGAAAPAAPPVDALTIAGQTIAAGQRPVTVSIRSDSGGDLGALRAIPDGKGNYRLGPPSPIKAGVYQVMVVAPDGRGKASATFRAVEPSGLGAQAQTALNEAVAAAQQGVAGAQAKVDAQTESPAKDKATRKLADARKALGELGSTSGAGAVKGIIGAIASDAALQERYRPRLAKISSAVDETAAETERVRKLTATMSSADIGCHQLAFVTEVFKGVSALLNLKKRVLDTSIGLAKDIVSDAASNKAKAVGAGPGLAFASGQAVKNLPELESATKLAGNAASILADLGAFVTDTFFGIYCEQFTGPINAIMNARFFATAPGGAPLTQWWSYNYKLTGRIVVYYPKAAKGGQPVRLNGRIEGYAHDFETWEDALTVMFPKLMAGAIQRKFNYPPTEMGGTAPAIASQGASPMSAYVEGSAAGLAMPNSFLIPVEGVLEKDSITVVLGPAQSDITAKHRVAVLILAPMAGGLGPQITWYPLPFQKVRAFLVNAADGESLKLSLKTSGSTMQAQGVFNGQVDKPKAKGEYTLKIKACNPGC
jgi:hypothetical protein